MSPSIRASTALLAASLLPMASAFWRIPCPSRLIDERIDPIIDPGQVSGHVHTVSGGNGFGFTMDYAQARASQCSSCPITQDLSNYWTPKLYFQAHNGSFIGVPQSGDGNGILGGMTVYYLQRPGPNNDSLKAFPEGFSMVAGNPFKRNETDDFAGQAISFVCLDYDNGSSYTSGFPDVNCPDGLRAQVFFPSCWDGVNLSSPDQSHVSYPESIAYNNGPCPASHPVHLISLFYEVIWNTGNFVDDWYGDSQPFVFAMGDPTGFGMHGDFYNGWDVPALQKAVDTCNDPSGVMQDCPVFDYFSDYESMSCKVPTVLTTNVNGPMSELPGCNPVTPGPETATPPGTCSREPHVKPANSYITDLTSKGWEYIGCGIDNVSNRTFTGSVDFDSTMTLQKCTAFCKQGGYKYAGAEYASQCYCGNTLPAVSTPQQGIYGQCIMPCGGNSAEVCGGPDALSIYQTCTGNSCRNMAVPLPGGYPTISTEKKRDLDGLLPSVRSHVRDFASV